MKNAATTPKNAETTAQALRGMVEAMKQLQKQMGMKAYSQRFTFERAMVLARTPVGGLR